MRRYGRVSGFTLVELAIVLAVMTLLVAGGLSVTTALRDAQQITTTRTRETDIKTALIGFIARNNRLPCPAVANLAPGAVGYGVEAATPGTCSGTDSFGSAGQENVRGVLPWNTLGLRDEAATDGYFNRFTYQIVRSATNLNPQTVSGMKGNITVHSATPIALGKPPTGNQANDCTVANSNPCAAVVTILSHGKNGAGAYTSNGSRLALPSAGTDEAENTNDDSSLVVKEEAAGANPYDDILMALTSSDLLSPLEQNGSIKSAGSILNADFDAIVGGIVGYGVQNRYGASPTIFYPLPATSGNVADVLVSPPPTTVTTDPWGSPIRYNFGLSSISAGSTGTAFALASNGPDGTAGNADDIQYTVTAAQLIGVLAKTGF